MDYFISSKNPAFIIAEIGVNHGGSIESALALIDEAEMAGADAVKFQAYKADRLASRHSPSYWDLDEEPINSQFELFSKYDSFGLEEYRLLHDHAVQKGIHFMLTCFDIDFVHSLSDLSPIMKIASADITNVPLLLAVAECAEAIVLSTGASSLEEVKDAYDLLKPFKKPISILHCVLNYPTPRGKAALKRISELKSLFPDTVIGYSDHTKPVPGNMVLNSAFVLGARVFEKHFSSNPEASGNDHYHSMNGPFLKTWISELIELNNSLNYSEGDFLRSQSLAIKNARRGIYASKLILRGEVFSKDNLITLRPTAFIGSEKWSEIIGNRALRDINEGDPIQISDYS